MVQNIITDLCHHLEIGIDGNLDIGNKRVIVGTPTITLTDNIFTISCDTAGASIYYTLDGSTPTSSSTKYTTAVTLNNSCTIKAIAIKGNKSSIVVSQDYIAILSAWKIVGNSEVHGVEIWSCGEYNAVDDKYHILVQPQGGSVADIALTEPLRKVDNIADSIEYADGVTTVTRYLKEEVIDVNALISINTSLKIYGINYFENTKNDAVCMCVGYTITNQALANMPDMSMRITYMYQSTTEYRMVWRNTNCDTLADMKDALDGLSLIFELNTPTTELVDAPQIEEAESYSCVISQGGKAVEWSSFTPNPS